MFTLPLSRCITHARFEDVGSNQVALARGVMSAQQSPPSYAWALVLQVSSQTPFPFRLVLQTKAVPQSPPPCSVMGRLQDGSQVSSLILEGEQRAMRLLMRVLR